ncbi:PREDICTED: epididymal secretory protein E1-like [Rhagoletis zephyria]|uniref:epididymal secretory protein E1-like n=1 Tax=Rhagoletis zephyria TaxID=28612 RepID=UPI000811A195|nr:PREDICTED: epididymal secretory protein E1-like [Rhagoletis zephyria]
MLKKLGLFSLILAIAAATEVKKCSDNQPFPLEVRVLNCEVPPCDVIKGADMIFEIDFYVEKYVTKLTTLVKATTFGLTVPYELPDDVRDVCSNLLYGAYCPLYATEDVTYQFVFPIGNYPEISVKVEIYLVDQDNEVATCFNCNIKVKKGPTSNSTVYQIDY